jgi:hypothetical protein
MGKLGLLLALLATAAAAQIALDQTTTKTFTDCSSGGSAAQTLTAGTYLMTVTTEDVWLCQAASASTCASNGTKFGAPFAMLYEVPRGGLSISCRSSGSTGDLQFTRKGN